MDYRLRRVEVDCERPIRLRKQSKGWDPSIQEIIGMIKRNLVLLTLGLSLAACAEASNEEDAAADSVATQPANAPAAGDSAAAVPTTDANGMLDPNAATAEQLAAIPGMTPELATSVVNGRPYADMSAFNAKLTGLTDEQRDTVYTRLWKPLDLNTATKEEIELIPGVGPRMRHEFEEYRPYTSMEQFRREIGKYVDANEVARLERYVTIRSAGQ
jgi:DNA uptake protein ComE-like DNA-binding protein